MVIFNALCSMNISRSRSGQALEPSLIPGTEWYGPQPAWSPLPLARPPETDVFLLANGGSRFSSEGSALARSGLGDAPYAFGDWLRRTAREDGGAGRRGLRLPAARGAHCVTHARGRGQPSPI